MTTFADRKASRVAAGSKQYEFNVTANHPISGEVLATFKSRCEAEDFAHKQVSAFADDTQAMRALSAKFGKTHHISSGQRFSVERAEVSSK